MPLTRCSVPESESRHVCTPSLACHVGQDAYFADFTEAWVKLQENGCSGLKDSL